jgi:hypothetical protein
MIAPWDPVSANWPQSWIWPAAQPSGSPGLRASSPTGRDAPASTPVGFARRNPLQHIWFHPRLSVAVQVPASILPRHSTTEEVQAPNGSLVTVWSTTDLMLDRLAQAVFGGAPERLDQALALRLVAGDEFEFNRACERAADDGPQMRQALDAFLRLYAALGTEGPPDAGTADNVTHAFWAEVDWLGLRR